MRRHLIRCCLALLATATGGGCQSLSTGKFAFRPPRTTFAKTEQDSGNTEGKPSPGSEEPESATASRSGTSGNRESDTPPASPQTKSRPPLDPATEILIENELKDATDDERAEWLARIETMTPRQITTALCERRSALAAEYDRDRRRMPEAPDPREHSAVDPADSERDADSIILASGSRSASAPQSTDDDAMRDELDAADRWDVESLPSDSSAAAPTGESRPASGPGPSAEPEFDIWGDPIPPRAARPRPAAVVQTEAVAATPVAALRFADDPVEEPQSPVTYAKPLRESAMASPPQTADTSASLIPPTVQPTPPAAPSPRIEPIRGSRLSDWDPTKLFTRRRAAEPPAAPESFSQEATLPPYIPGASSNQADRLGSLPLDPAGEAAFSARRIDPQAPYTMDELRRLVSLMEAEAEASVPGSSPELQREYLRRHINLRFMRLVANQRAEAQEPIPGLDPVDQEFWNSVFWGLSNYLDNEGIIDPTERAAATAAQFQAAARHLQSTARLELKNVAFCHRIDGFGSFERFERDEFQAGVPVLVYAEVRNFSSEPTRDGRFLTTLRSTVEIVRVGVQQVPVDRMTFEPTEDRSRSPRTDFYNSYKINLPATLPPGPYQLRLTVEDESSGKIATQTLNFLIR